MNTEKKGFFITLEGMEGCGKSTQICLLAQSLRNAGYEVVETRSPGGTPIAEKIREILKVRNPEESLTPEAELLLFGACHAQMTKHLVRDVLDRGAILISDRFFDSTTAYQGYARGLGPELIECINRFSCGEIRPDLTLVLDLPVETGLARSEKRAPTQGDRFDSEKLSFHQAVRSAFLEMASKEPERFCIIHADRSPEQVTQEIREAVHARLGIL